MKKTALSLILLCCLLQACTYGSLIGNSEQPEKDKLSTAMATFDVQSATVLTDSIRQRSNRAVVGEYTDPYFGTTQAGFMCQLYCPPAFKFPTITDNKIDSVFLYLFYDEWFGDDDALLEASVYKLDRKLDLDATYYTNIDVDSYCSRSERLGAATFTPQSAENSWTDGTDYCVRVALSTAFAEQLLQDYLADSTRFDGPRNFADCFEGLYITSTYGNGGLVYITDAQLEICYRIKHLGSDGVLRDTTSASYFPMSKEVKQINSYSHPDLTSYLADIDNDTLNFIYAPAGLYTQVSLPLNEICSQLSEKNINYARLKVAATALADEDWALSPTEKLLLLNENYLHSFFDGYSTADDLYSFVAEYDDDEACYIFDVSKYVQKSIRSADGELDSSQVFVPFDKMVIVPVEEVQNTDKVSLYLLQDVRPSALKLRSGNILNGDRRMMLELVYSSKRSMVM